MTETPTSYSLLVMFRDVIYAVRDPYGNRPLCIGRLVPISKLYSSGIFSMCVHVSDPFLLIEYLLIYIFNILKCSVGLQQRSAGR